MALPTQTTLLSAANTVLRSINESPVSSLTPPYTQDVGFALECINEVQVEILGHGWSFNEESDVTLVVDVDFKYALAADELQITPDSPRQGLQLVPRDDGGTLRLYNKAPGQHTFVLPSGLKVTKVRSVDFEDMPEPFRRYVTIRAARTFAARLRSGDALPYTAEEEVRAKKALRDYEVDTNRPSAFDSFTGRRPLRRGYPQTERGDW